MGYNWPSFGNCSDCGNGNTEENCVQIPCPTTGDTENASTTPDEIIDNPIIACNSNKGKYYDKTIANFVVPSVGNTVNVAVCEPSLWSSCQWLAVCYPTNQIAYFKVVAVTPEDGLITLLNACSDGEPIRNNPSIGTVISLGAVIYAVAPPWCTQDIKNLITEIIESGEEDITDSIMEILNDAENVCFQSIPDLSDGREAHLFGGDYDGSPYQSNPSLLQSCLRKLRRIYTRFTGRTICFQDIPTTSDDPEGSPPVPKRYVYLDGNNCLRKGAIVNSNTCGDSLNQETLDAISGCKSGAKALLTPSDRNKIIVSKKDDYGNPYWTEENGGNGRMFYPLSTPVSLTIFNQSVSTGFNSINFTGTFLAIDSEVPPEINGRQRYAEIQVDLNMNLAGLLVVGQVRVTSSSITLVYLNGTNTFNDPSVFPLIGASFGTMGSAMVPVSSTTPKQFEFNAAVQATLNNTDGIQDTMSFNSTAKLMGYWA